MKPLDLNHSQDSGAREGMEAMILTQKRASGQRSAAKLDLATRAARTVALAALLAIPVLAPAENVVEVGFGEGAPGEFGIRVIVTAVNDVAVHGYSLALSFPADVLQLTDLSINGTHVAPMAPDFAEETINNPLGIGVLGVILNFDDFSSVRELRPLAEGAAPRIIARLTFSVRAGAPGGLYPLRLVDGVGNPASFNRFTSAGTSIRPRLIDGQFLVEGGNVLTLEKRQAFCGATPSVQLTAFAQHPDPLDGFSIGLTYDCLAVNVLDMTFNGTSLGIELGRDRVEFFQADTDESLGPALCRARVAAIFDRVPPFDGQRLSASPNSPTGQSLMRYTFSFNNGAIDCPNTACLDFLLEELDQPGALNNTFVVGGESITPRRVHGKVYYSTGDVRGRVVDAITRLPINNVAVTTDPDNLMATTAANGTFTIVRAIPGTYTLKLAKTGYYTSVRQDVTVRGFNLVENLGDLVLYLTPPDAPGTVVPYKRGFINTDPRVDLSDAVALLNFLFRGLAPPPCMAAADTNNDNRVDISDAIYLLRWLFAGGAEPTAPFLSCGFDPNPANPPIACEEFPAGCP
jgi:hypothetical protein